MTVAAQTAGRSQRQLRKRVARGGRLPFESCFLACSDRLYVKVNKRHACTRVYATYIGVVVEMLVLEPVKTKYKIIFSQDI